jgi:uncharacterized protein YbaR (Trm112 family)
MLDPVFLEMLACPETHEPLKVGDAALVAAINRRIASGELRRRDGGRITEPVEGLLVRADGRIAYPIRDQFPLLLIDEALTL